MTPAAPRRIQKHEEAKRNLVEIYAYLFERNERSARNFLHDARKAFELIRDMPGIGRRWVSSEHSSKGLRVTAVSRRFHDYLIFYRPARDAVQIITILHGARDLPPLIDSLPLD